MAKKRNIKNDRELTAKQRQQKASKAAGQQKLAYHGRRINSDGFNQKFYAIGPASAKGRITQSSRILQPGERLDKQRRYVDQLWLHNQSKRVAGNIPKSQKAAAKFRATEKKKSSRNRAKNTKRRER
jgi:S-adenosylmethionine:diacylglycerol 3-amino-3-carboxypropyl transferase